MVIFSMPFKVLKVLKNIASRKYTLSSQKIYFPTRHEFDKLNGSLFYMTNLLD